MPEEDLHGLHPDDPLVRRAQQGDERAFEELIDGHRNRLYTLAVRELGSAADAEDAVQEALVRAWRGLPRFRAESSFSTWIYRICLNAVSDQRARAAKRATTPLEDVREPRDPRDPVAESELSSSLQRALAGLEDGYREAVILYDVLGRSYAEIAEVLAIPEGTVKSRIFRGRAELARRLGTVHADEQSNL